MPYYRGQGRVLVGGRDSSGHPTVFRYVGNVPELTVDLETEVLEHEESTSGQSLTDMRMAVKKKASAKFVIEEFSKENIAMALFGASSTISAGTVTNETLPSGIVAGNIVRLQKAKASSIVVKDSAGTPATLTANTHYKVFSADHGSLEFLDVAGFTQPFKVDYSNGEVININMLTQGLSEVWLRFEGLNTADTNKPVLLELYKFSYEPAKNLGLITNDLQKFELAGSPLYDATKAADAVLGQFGRVVFI